MQEMQVQSLVQEDPLEKKMATQSSILAWKILWTSGKESSCQCRRLPMQEMQVQSLVQEDPLEKKTATQSSILA